MGVKYLYVPRNLGQLLDDSVSSINTNLGSGHEPRGIASKVNNSPLLDIWISITPLMPK